MLKQHGLNDTFVGGIGSYTLVLMAAAYLQVSSFLLVLYSLSRQFFLSFSSYPFQIRAKSAAPIPCPKEANAVYLLGFLEFFSGQFDYVNCTLSVREGGSIVHKVRPPPPRPLTLSLALTLTDE